MITPFLRRPRFPLPAARWALLLGVVAAAAVATALQHSSSPPWPAARTGTMDGLLAGLVFGAAVLRLLEQRAEQEGSGRRNAAR